MEALHARCHRDVEFSLPVICQEGHHAVCHKHGFLRTGHIRETGCHLEVSPGQFRFSDFYSVAGRLHRREGTNAKHHGEGQ